MNPEHKEAQILKKKRNIKKKININTRKGHKMKNHQQKYQCEKCRNQIRKQLNLQLELWGKKGKEKKKEKKSLL